MHFCMLQVSQKSVAPGQLRKVQKSPLWKMITPASSPESPTVMYTVRQHHSSSASMSGILLQKRLTANQVNVLLCNGCTEQGLSHSAVAEFPSIH